MLTRSVVKAFLIDRYVLSVLCAPVRSAIYFNGLSATIYNHKLPEDVLLEIFDAYRQLYELQPNYETLWNSVDGWLKLVHVCLQWRRVLLLSTCRLHVHMLFTPSQPSRGPLSRCLTRLPIWVDYSTASWNIKEEENLALAVLEQRSLVRGIILGPCPPDRLLSALSRPFPNLENLDIGSTTSTHHHWRIPVLPSMSLPSLRRLTLRGVTPSYISPLLSSAKGRLVELTLTLIVEHRALPEHSFIANLQRLSCLRRLELKLSYVQGVAIIPPSPSPPPPASAGDAVTLSKLTDLIFTGHCSYLRMLVVALAAPSLQHLDVEIYRTSPDLPIPQLCKFIRDTENQFFGVSLYLLQEKFMFSAVTSLPPDSAQSFSIIFPKPFVQLKELGNNLSGPLSTVERLVIEYHSPYRLGMGLSTQHHIKWGGFFNHIPQVKVIQVASEVANEVAHSLKQGDLLSLLPSLEQVKVDFYTRLPISDRDSQYKTIREAFKPIIATRKQAGRRIKLSRLGSQRLMAR